MMTEKKTTTEEAPLGIHCQEHGEHSIELDCPPGNLRPWNLIEGVCKGTPLAIRVNGEPVFAFFGMSRWEFSGFTCEEWDKIQKVTKKRIIALYNAGGIRYGTW